MIVLCSDTPYKSRRGSVNTALPNPLQLCVCSGGVGMCVGVGGEWGEVRGQRRRLYSRQLCWGCTGRVGQLEDPSQPLHTANIHTYMYIRARTITCIFIIHEHTMC